MNNADDIRFVIPAEAGIHVAGKLYINKMMDSRFHGNDMYVYTHIFDGEINFYYIGNTINDFCSSLKNLSRGFSR